MATATKIQFNGVSVSAANATNGTNNNGMRGGVSQTTEMKLIKKKSDTIKLK